MTLSQSTERTLAGLRVDLVGSFLRPDALKNAFVAFERGEIDHVALRTVQDLAIRRLIETEEAHGLPLVTDGEFRRVNFQQSFYDVAGFAWSGAWIASQRAGRDEGPGFTPSLMARQRATEPLRLAGNQVLTEYTAAALFTDRPVKITLIGPDRIVQSYDEPGSRDVYRNVDEFVDGVVAVQRTMIEELRDAGCRYVQIDEPSYTAYVDERSIADMRERGQDPAQNLARSIRADNAIVRAFPEMTFGIHLCRGNRQSHWHREGSYDAIAEQLFNSLDHDRFLLEYDTERAGSFEPLRFVPKGKMVVLGLITTKTGEIESLDALQRRIDEASRFCPIDQLALSPQCGFASSLAGNRLSEADQWRKIDVMLEAAARIWGAAATV